MTARLFEIHVDKVKPGSAVPLGRSLEPTARPIQIGRSAENDVALPDPTVSSRHVLVRPAPDGHALEIVNESAHGTTALDGERLAPGEVRRVEGELAWLQLGRVLLRVSLAPETVPVDELITLPEPERGLPEPLLRIRRYASRCEQWCCGHVVALYPSAARLLARLCETPCALVTTSELALAVEPSYFERAGGTNVAQLVSYVRSMLEQAIAEGHLDLERLVGVLDSAGAAPPAAERDDVRAVLRRVLENVRGTGYILRVPAHEIVLEEH